MALGGISSATSCALYGIQQTSNGFEKAVDNVVRSGAAMSDSAQFSSAAMDKLRAAESSEASLERGLVDQRLAVHMLAANVSVIRTADEMLDTLTKLGDDR